MKKKLTKKLFMFSFFFLYYLIDYEYLLSLNELSLEQEQLFLEGYFEICRDIFEFIIERNSRKCLKKYAVNEKIINIFKENDLNYLSNYFFLRILDREEIEELLKSNGIENSSYNDLKRKYNDDTLFEKEYDYSCYLNQVDIILSNKDRKIIRNLIEKLKLEKIIYLLANRSLFDLFSSSLLFFPLNSEKKIKVKRLKNLRFFFFDREDSAILI